MAGTGAVRRAKFGDNHLAVVRQLLIEEAFRLTVPGVDLPGQDADVRAEVIHMPMPDGGAVDMPVHTCRQPTPGATGVGVVAAGEGMAAQTANGELAGDGQPEQ
jgi:hypothetical protein